MSSTESLDDVISCLLGMGFEIEDCQAAIQSGRLSVQEAVDWMLAGKPVDAPSQAAAQGTLRLGQPSQSVGANPFMGPHPQRSPPDGAPEACSQASAAQEEDEEAMLQSRLHCSDEQRQSKLRFEEKERLEAQRIAKEERLAKKRAHTQILNQIAQDREEKVKSKQTSTAAAESIAASQGSSSSSSSSGAAAAASPPEEKVQESLLQIRLPDGRSLKKTFRADSPMSSVWSFVKTKFPQCTNHMCLMQPFPRQEYGASDMGVSLVELGLTPTGSLVLKKVESPVKAPEPESSMEADGDDPTHQPASAAAPPPPAPHPAYPHAPHPQHPPTHSWGSGSKLEGQEMEVVSSDEGDESEDDFAAGQPPHHAPLPYPPVAGGGGGAGGGWGGGGGAGAPGFHQPFAGIGQRLVGEVLNVDNLPHQRQAPKDLAGEAANQRYQVQPDAAEGEEAGPSSTLMYNMPRLTELIINHVTSRICDTRKPISGLHGLPADVASIVLDHLIKDNLLRPKTLNAFVSCHLRRLVLDCYPYTTNELLTAIRLHTSLVHLSLCSCPLITDKGLQALNSLKRLKSLNLGGCQQLKANCMPVISELPSLVTLILEDTGLTDDGVINYAQTSPQCLAHLDLSRTEVTHCILTALQAIPNLKTLNLEQTKVGSLSGVQNLVQLEALNVASAPIMTEALLCLAGHPNLRLLNIANTPNVQGDLALQYISNLQLNMLHLPSRLSTTDHGLQYISAMPLHSLDLTNYISITDVGMERVGRITSLKKLWLSNTKITDSGMVFLEGLSSLEELYLDRSIITDKGATIIKAFPRLQELSLSETRISNALLRSGALQDCSQLSKVNLARTAISDKGLSCLALPYLTILNVDGTMIRPQTADLLTHSPKEVIPGCPRLQRVSANNPVPPQGIEEDD